MEPYVYADDVAPLLPAGTMIELTAWHDNPAGNRLTVTPVRSAQRSATQPEAATFNIYGHVITPGSYAWSDGITVKQAVALAGGYDSRGSKRELQIQRMVDVECGR